MKLWRTLGNYKMLYLFLLPAVLVTFIFNYIPLVGVVMAFQDFNIVQGYFGSPFVGLDNFKNFLDNPDFYTALRNTLAMSFLLIIIGFPVPILFAIMINEMKNKAFKRIAQTLTYLPHFLSWVVISGLIYRMLEEYFGAVNLLLNALGLDKIAFLRDPDYFWGILVSGSIWKDMGWNSIIYLAAMAGIDPALYEAATIDGAGRWKKILYITLPGIAPVIGLLLIFNIGTLVGGASFDAVYNLHNPLVGEKAMTLDYFVYLEGIRQNNPSLASAVGLTFSLVSFGLVLTANLISKKVSGYRAF
ncbi:ABC transporter permease [Paenibacillus sp. GCM10023252]|uniref:ABC transporter permease n=1 Tax=Paenibacillus sp. GCM10023252 TaxID=3252649 RepID=UPI003611DB48